MTTEQQEPDYMSGNQWYSQQAIAPESGPWTLYVIAHDYGALFLVDQRFASFIGNSQLSKWLQNAFAWRIADGTMKEKCKAFFQEAPGFVKAKQESAREQEMRRPLFITITVSVILCIPIIGKRDAEGKCNSGTCASCSPHCADAGRGVAC